MAPQKVFEFRAEGALQLALPLTPPDALPGPCWRLQSPDPDPPNKFTLGAHYGPTIFISHPLNSSRIVITF